MAFLDAPTPIAFAHRGFAPDGGENSMAAFQRAIDLGYRYLETDVRVTSDGVALAFHDARLDRVTDHNGIVASLPWGAVREARIAGEHPIPLLADVLAAWPDARVNIDVKSAVGIVPTVDAVRRTTSVDRVCIASFSGARIAAVRQMLGPGVCTALRPREALALRLSSALDRRATPAPGRRRPGLDARVATGPQRCIQVPPRIGRFDLVDRRYLAAAHRAGLQVHVWTVNERSEITRLLDLGVDGVITDRADLLREVLLERDQWRAPTGPGG